MPFTELDGNSIRQVSEACGCTELRARSLLHVKNGNVEQAIEWFFAVHVNPATSTSPPVSGNAGPASTRSGSRTGHRRADSTSPSSGGEILETWFPPGDNDEGGPAGERTNILPAPTTEGGNLNHGSHRDARHEDDGAASANFASPESGHSPTDSRASQHTSLWGSPPDSRGSQHSPEKLNEASMVECKGQDGIEGVEETINLPDIGGAPEPASEPREWDFVLPVLEQPLPLMPGGPEGISSFALEDFVGAVQHGTSYDQIRLYLTHHDEDTTKAVIRTGKVEGFPVMFYAVQTNDEWIIREFARFDGDINEVYGKDRVPLLAFVAVNSHNLNADTTVAVSTLLSLGATVDVIPRAFYSPFCIDLPRGGPGEDLMPDLKDENKRWCASEAVRHTLAKSLNLTQRYYMEKSLKIKKPSTRARQVAKLRSSEPLLGIPYFLIGQAAATGSVIDHLLSYMTKLARQLGHLLSLETEVVDCTTFTYENELFGPRAPYVGSDQGSPLNNFLARKNGERSIVFLDEFEKTGPSIHNVLLIPFDKGEYEDRRHRKRVDCSQTIWVLATNALDEQIKAFCEEHKAVIMNDNDHTERPILIKKLSKVIKKEFKEQFKPPLTGRISAFIPFLPFSPGEQAVGAHKFVLELAQEVRRPINLQRGPQERLLGNIHLHVRRDASVCRQIAEEGYDADLGIRSLIAGVRDTVELSLRETYLKLDEDIEETEEMTDYLVDVRNEEITVTMSAPTDG